MLAREGPVKYHYGTFFVKTVSGLNHEIQQLFSQNFSL